jgi:hypothetical protein
MTERVVAGADDNQRHARSWFSIVEPGIGRWSGEGLHRQQALGWRGVAGEGQRCCTRRSGSRDTGEREAGTGALWSVVREKGGAGRTVFFFLKSHIFHQPFIEPTEETQLSLAIPEANGS